jgi:fimbrial isopeptide formation D2 family protein/uncharacterized repeat protein (TIGR01451 family)
VTLGFEAASTALIKSDGRATASVGETVSYTLTLNALQASHYGVVITDTLPAGLVYNTGSAVVSGFSAAPTLTVNGSTLVWNFGSSVNVTSPATVRFTARVTGGADGAVLTNTVTMTQRNVFNAAMPPLRALDDFTIANVPEISLTKSDGSVTASPGQVFIYTLSYANNGGRAATGVVITETVPANTTFNAAASSPTVWSCPDGAAAGTICTTTIGGVAAGASANARFAVQVNNGTLAGTIITNTAMIADDGLNGVDFAPANNTASDTTPVYQKVYLPLVMRNP